MVSFFKQPPYAPTAADEQLTCIQAFGTAGEMLSLSFGIRSSESIDDIEFTSSDLESATAVVSKSCISLYVVKVWEQAGIGVYQSTRMRVSELLVKDDRESLRDGYTRRGVCGHLKHMFRASRLYKPPAIRLEGDAYTSLRSGKPKQIWVSIRIPLETAPGLYEGYLEARDGNHRTWRLEVQIEVLPIKLLEAQQDLFMWYKGILDCRRPQHYVSETSFRLQLQDIYDHGFRSISLNEYEPEHLQRALNIANSIGFNRHVVLTAPYPERFLKIDFKGLTPFYYISDEIDSRDGRFISDHVKNWHAIKSAGGQTMASLVRQSFAKRLSDKDDIGCCPDVLSFYLPANLNYFVAHSEFQKLREQPAYYYWQSHMEKPLVHRILAGLYLWKSKADGIAPYCYQHLPAPPFSPFDDFDEWEPDFRIGTERRPFKDHMTTYPARGGSIPTTQWKGIADGINDLRYLVTFEDALRNAESCRSNEVMQFAVDARQRSEQFLQRVSLKEINILSETEPAPYKDITSEEYSGFREQLARDIVELEKLIKTYN